MPTELKPCPFCGGEAELIKQYHLDGQTHYEVAKVRCSMCKCQTDDYILDGYYGSTDTAQDAVDDWNKRIDDSSSLLVIKVNAFMGSKDWSRLAKSIHEQKRIGTIMLPPYCDAIVTPNNCEVKIEAYKADHTVDGWYCEEHKENTCKSWPRCNGCNSFVPKRKGEKQ